MRIKTQRSNLLATTGTIHDPRPHPRPTRHRRPSPRREDLPAWTRGRGEECRIDLASGFRWFSLLANLTRPLVGVPVHPLLQKEQQRIRGNVDRHSKPEIPTLGDVIDGLGVGAEKSPLDEILVKPVRQPLGPRFVCKIDWIEV